MFNLDAEQIFILQPRNAGGGILSFLLSLDSQTASVNFKKYDIDTKLAIWHQNIKRNQSKDAHIAGNINFASDGHAHIMKDADHCCRYVHKNHFYELDQINDQKQHSLLNKLTGEKKSIGIYFTNECVEQLQKLRPQTLYIDFYQKWIYSNQKKLLKDFYEISSLHQLPFKDMLDKDIFIDHIKYCKDILNLDIDLDVVLSIISDWHQILKLHCSSNG